MTLKDYAAIVTGALCMVLAAIYLYTCTDLAIQDVGGLSLLADAIGIVAVYAFTEPKKKHRKKVRGVPIITLDRTEWEKGKAMHL